MTRPRLLAVTLALRAAGRRGASRAWLALIPMWLVLVLLAMVAMQRYESTPSSTESAPTHWPPDSHISRSSGLPVLIMLAHPYCPCTRASLAELSRLLTTLSGRLDVHVLFIRPEGVDADWGSSDLLERARQIPNVSVDLDDAGREAALLGARTSGDTLLYGADGRLLFHGGITSARGHEGDNVGSRRIISLVTTGSTDLASSAVFGCALSGDAPP